MRTTQIPAFQMLFVLLPAAFAHGEEQVPQEPSAAAASGEASTARASAAEAGAGAVSTLPGFDSIKADGQVILEVSIGAAEQAVTVETRGGAREDLELRVKGRTLRVREDSDVEEQRGRPLYLVRIEVPQLTTVNVGAGSRTEVTGVDADRFEVRTTTGAKLRVAGRCGELVLSVNTGGIVDARELRCERARARANTGGVARVHASAAVDAGAHTGGEIDVFGGPSEVDKGAWLGGEVSVRSERS